MAKTLQTLKRGCSAAALMGLTLAASAQSTTDWRWGAVLDLTHTEKALALGQRDQGLQLGHSDLTASGPVGSLLRAQLTAAFETHDKKLEKGIEEAWLESTRLPGGLQARAGRFASQIGYLNQQHPHADDFVERPLLYRSFLGGHWNDDGLRLNWTAPTPFYLMFGAEAFRGKRLVEETASKARTPGVATLVVKTGADFNRSSSWQLGLSHMRNRREAAVEADVEDEHEEEGEQEGHDAAHDHDHGHGARFTGRKTWMIDATWKWAPNGNNRDRQVRLGAEAAQITGLNRYAGSGDKHRATALSLVWRLRADWEVGVRADDLRARSLHGEHFHATRLRERSVMLAWKPSHMQSLRLQLTNQRDAVQIDMPAKRSIQLQYVLAFGAHGSHAY